MLQYPGNSDELTMVHAEVTRCEYEVRIAIAGEVGDAKLRRIYTQMRHLRSKKQTVDAALNDSRGCSRLGLQASRASRASHREMPPKSKTAIPRCRPFVGWADPLTWLPYFPRSVPPIPHVSCGLSPRLERGI